MLDELIALAHAAAKVIPGGEQAVAVADAALGVVRAALPSLTGDEAAALARASEPLETKLAEMNRAVDQAVADLKGN